MNPRDEHEDDLRFLVCRACDSCCLLAGPAGRAIADAPPVCPGCGAPMQITSRPSLRHAS